MKGGIAGGHGADRTLPAAHAAHPCSVPISRASRVDQSPAAAWHSAAATRRSVAPPARLSPATCCSTLPLLGLPPAASWAGPAAPPAGAAATSRMSSIRLSLRYAVSTSSTGAGPGGLHAAAPPASAPSAAAAAAAVAPKPAAASPAASDGPGAADTATHALGASRNTPLSRSVRRTSCCKRASRWGRLNWQSR